MKSKRDKRFKKRQMPSIAAAAAANLAHENADFGSYPVADIGHAVAYVWSECMKSEVL